MKKLIKYEFFKLKKKTIFMIFFFVFLFWSIVVPIFSKIEIESWAEMNRINLTNEQLQLETIASIYNFDGHYSFLIMLTLLVLSTTIIGEEFSTGTVKLLYIRPYKRFKHYLSKFIVVLFTILLFSIMFLVETYAVTACIFKENILLLYPMAQTMIISIIATIPNILIFQSIFFLISYIVINTPVALVINFIIWYILNMFGVPHNSIPIMPYTFIRYWNFPRFIFGSENNDVDNPLLKSIIICTIYLILFIILGIYAEKHKDIKNEQ